jgi:hypothetical protein
VLGLSLLAACSGGPQRFPLTEPFWQDTDLRPVHVDCERRPDKDDPAHIACAPEPYVSPLAWDGADNSVFRPLSEVFAVDPGGEAVNVNALDEVPDSAWFTNRIGRRHPTRDELLRGACTPEQVLNGEGAAPGSWVIDQGKTNGASLGFRVRVQSEAPDGSKSDRKFMFKNDAPNQPERATAASAIGAAIYHAVGFYTSCEQIVYFDRDVLQLKPGLKSTDNSGVTKPFDAKALDNVLNQANRKGSQYRMQASAWLPGYLLGPFRYEGTRDDDPNDVIAHEDRRDLRGARVLAAWINHFDAREQNSMDSWITSSTRGPDRSPGYVRHYYIDTSDCFGSEWEWDGISRRLGRSYLFDWGDIGADFITLGIPVRPWERVERKPGFELFGYFGVDEFEPDGWKNEYPNPAFSRATERDNAWMARILSRFDRSDIAALVTLGEFTNPEHEKYLAYVLEGRLQSILERYFGRLSPLADPKVVTPSRLCFTDLARRRQVWPAAKFQYRAVLAAELGAPHELGVEAGAGGAVCVDLPRQPEPRAAPIYARLRITNGVAPGPIDAYLYDRGAAGYHLAGLERPASND